MDVATLTTLVAIIGCLVGLAGWYRNSSKDAEAGEIEHPYTHSVTYETEEVPEMTTAEAYNYLKTLPAFEGAEDC